MLSAEHITFSRSFHPDNDFDQPELTCASKCQILSRCKEISTFSFAKTKKNQNRQSHYSCLNSKQKNQYGRNQDSDFNSLKPKSP